MLGFDLSSAATLQHFRSEFEEVGRAGSGGFSTVYRVRNKRDSREYALKVVKIRPSLHNGQLSDQLEKLLQEAKLLAALRHPNILPYCGCWIDADLDDQPTPSSHDDDDAEFEMVCDDSSLDSCGVSFEKLAGHSSKQKNSKKMNTEQFLDSSDYFFGTNLRSYKEIRVNILCELGQHSLQRHVQERHRHRMGLSKKAILIENYRIILDVIEGLAYLHSQKIIHRDLKLQNIIHGRDRKFKIIDYGLAKRTRGHHCLHQWQQSQAELSSEDCEKHSNSVGTKFFSSPEQTSSNSYDHRTDIYSLGMVMGTLFASYSTAHEESEMLGNLRNKKLENIEMDEKLKLLVLKCLSEESSRPTLKQLKICVKGLLKKAATNLQNRDWAKMGKFCHIKKGIQIARRMPTQLCLHLNDQHLEAEKHQNKSEQIVVEG